MRLLRPPGKVMEPNLELIAIPSTIEQSKHSMQKMGLKNKNRLNEVKSEKLGKTRKNR